MKAIQSLRFGPGPDGGNSIPRAQSVPKRLDSCPLAQAPREQQSQQPSHFPTHATIDRHRPSNVWGVGYRLLADYEEVRFSA
jgi:hypothetical protein